MSRRFGLFTGIVRSDDDFGCHARLEAAHAVKFEAASLVEARCVMRTRVSVDRLRAMTGASDNGPTPNHASSISAATAIYGEDHGRNHREIGKHRQGARAGR
ncbi:MAG TPA: hypothetical protein VGL52_06015, partial [Casimicrobiaceae bacterium]